MLFQLRREPEQVSLLLLILALFISYLCVAIPLTVVPVFTTQQLGLGNAWAGLGVGIAFLSTILTRGVAGTLSDSVGAKPITRRGLIYYAAGALLSAFAGLTSLPPMAAFIVMITGRLLVGFGESLVGVGIITWGIGLAGPARTGKVLALVGASLYGALAVGGPLGLILLKHTGFAGAMAASVALPCLGLLAIGPIAGVALAPPAQRPSLLVVLGRIWGYGLIVCLQGIGFAAVGAFFSLLFLNHQWAHAGLGITAFGAGFVLVRLVFGSLPDRLGGLPVAIVSLAIEAVGQLLIWEASIPEGALIGAFMTGLGCSLIFPSMGKEVVHRVPAHLRGTAVGGFTAFQDLAYGLTGPLAGLLADSSGYRSVFLMGGIAALGGFIIAMGLYRVSKLNVVEG